MAQSSKLKEKNHYPFLFLNYILNKFQFSHKTPYMDYMHIVFAILCFSSSLFLFLPNLKKWQTKKTTIEKLKLISEALERAEERVIRYEKRHDCILNEICSLYLVNAALEEALMVSRDAVNEAMEMVLGLRKLQIEIIRSYPDDTSRPCNN